MPALLQVKVGELGKTFGTYAGLVARGAVYEITEYKKVLARLQGSNADFPVLKSLPEMQASRYARSLAEEVAREQQAVQIDRLGAAPIFMVPVVK